VPSRAQTGSCRWQSSLPRLERPPSRCRTRSTNGRGASHSPLGPPPRRGRKCSSGNRKPSAPRIGTAALAGNATPRLRPHARPPQTVLRSCTPRPRPLILPHRRRPAATALRPRLDTRSTLLMGGPPRSRACSSTKTNMLRIIPKDSHRKPIILLTKLDNWLCSSTFVVFTPPNQPYSPRSRPIGRRRRTPPRGIHSPASQAASAAPPFAAPPASL